MSALDPLLEKILVCPRDYGDLRLEGTALVCSAGHRYPCVEGVPVMLLAEAEATLAVCDKTLQQVSKGLAPNNGHLSAASPVIDPFVQKEIAGTNGNMYRHLINVLPRYPIPDLRLPEATGQVFLDIGCNWGRWCLAAARKGYQPIGIDPSLEAVLAARRVANQMGLKAVFLVADARYLPFKMNCIDTVFSYSVLQHFSEADVKLVLAQAARVLKPSGICYVQMATKFGLRNLFIQLRRAFRRPHGFEVRYWTLGELQQAFQSAIGYATLSVDGYFSLNPQPTDLDLLPLRYRLIVRGSEALRRISEKAKWLAYFADSVYVSAIREPLAAPQ